jgi:hypothetical protein
VISLDEKIYNKLPAAVKGYIVTLQQERDRASRLVAELDARLQKMTGEQVQSHFYCYDDMGDMARRRYIDAREVNCTYNDVTVTLTCDDGPGVEVRFNQANTLGRCAILPVVSNVFRIVPYEDRR